MPDDKSNEWCILVIQLEGGTLSPKEAIACASLRACYKMAPFILLTRPAAVVEFHNRPKGSAADAPWTRHCGYVPEFSRLGNGDQGFVTQVPHGSFMTDAVYLWEVVPMSSAMETTPYPDLPMLRCYRQLPPAPGTKRGSFKFNQGDIVNAVGAQFIFVGDKAKADAVFEEATTLHLAAKAAAEAPPVDTSPMRHATRRAILASIQPPTPMTRRG